MLNACQEHNVSMTGKLERESTSHDYFHRGAFNSTLRLERSAQWRCKYQKRYFFKTQTAFVRVTQQVIWFGAAPVERFMNMSCLGDGRWERRLYLHKNTLFCCGALNVNDRRGSGFGWSRLCRHSLLRETKNLWLFFSFFTGTRLAALNKESERRNVSVYPLTFSIPDNVTCWSTSVEGLQPKPALFFIFGFPLMTGGFAQEQESTLT